MRLLVHHNQVRQSFVERLHTMRRACDRLKVENNKTNNSNCVNNNTDDCKAEQVVAKQTVQM